MTVATRTPAHREHRSARAAAWIALVAIVLAVADVVVLVVRHPLVVPFTIAAAAVVGAAGWLALTRRGVVRFLALAAVVAAVVVAAALLISREALVELIVAVGLVLIALTASRVALAEAARPERAAAQAAPRRRQTDRHVLLMNPKSGGGKVERFNLVDEARKRRIEPVVLRPGDDLELLARELIRDADVIGMAGGDGSQALVAAIAMRHDVPYVCVPAGTRNHLARDLGLDVEDVAGSLDAFASDVEHRIDLGFVNGRVFVNNVSFGIYAQIVQSPEYRDAKLRTMERMLPELLGPSAQEFDLRFRGPGGGAERSAQLLLVSNNRYVLDRLDGLGSRPRIDGGELGIVAVQIDGSAAAAELLALQTVGQVRRFPGWEEWTAQSFEIRSSGPIAAGIDGEAVTLDPPLNLWIVPDALGVRLPPQALGLSRAALMPTGNALRDLGRIAVTGRV